MADDSPKAFDAGTDDACPAYNAQFHPAVAERLYAKGTAKRDVAEAFEVSPEELSNWERDHTEFHEACERGRSAAVHQVENALYKRATGYVQSNERLTNVHGELVRVPHHRQVPPSVAAIRLLLTRGKATGDVAGDRAREYLKQLKPKTIVDIIADNEKKWKNGMPDDD